MWQNKNNALHARIEFADFTAAFAFIKLVAALAESMNHHPRIQIDYKIVDIWLMTHDAGNQVTDIDWDMAKAIENLYEEQAEEISPKEQIPVGVEEMKLYTDGGSRGNPGPSAGGFALLDMEDNVVKTSGKYLGITTNNQAEYHSLKGGLEAARDLHARRVHVFMDSLLVINQMKGVYKIRNRDLWPIHQAIKDLLANFEQVTFTHVPRELNKLADSIVNETLDEKAKA